MLFSILQFVIGTVASLFGVLFLLRAWVWRWAFSPRHPLVDLARRATDWLVVPLSRVVPAKSNWDWPSLLGALILAFATVLVNRLTAFYPISPLGMVLAPIFTLVRWGLEMVSWGTLIWCVLSWVNRQSPMGYALETLLEPFLRPCRKILPSTGSIDFSPLLLILAANVLLFIVVPLSRGFIPF